MTLPPPTLQDMLAADNLPALRWINGTREYQVVHSVPVDTRYGHVIIASGFRSDGMSDPIGRTWGRQGWPAIVHDWGYRMQPEGWTRAQWDMVFLDLMIEFGVRPWRAWARYGILRLVGWVAWMKNKRKLMRDK